MASVSTPSANEPAKDLIVVHIKHIYRISDVAFASIHYEKTRLKKLIMIL